jgi:hypothetical protein
MLLMAIGYWLLAIGFWLIANCDPQKANNENMVGSAGIP